MAVLCQHRPKLLTDSGTSAANAVIPSAARNLALKTKAVRDSSSPPAHRNDSQHAFFCRSAIWALFAVTLLALAAIRARSETLDRVVASVGDAAITESEVRQEYRMERFLDGQWPSPPPEAGALDHVRERLTYQLLLSREETPTPEELGECRMAATERVAELHKKFSGREDFSRTLGELGMTEADIVKRLTEQELLLRMIEQRLRPSASPTDEDVASYYRETFVPEFRKSTPSAEVPRLSEVEAQIRQVLTEKRVNVLLDQWIEELRPTSRVRIHSF